MKEEMKEIKKEIEIKPTGSFFEVDKDGFLVNPTSIEKIQPEWQPVVDAVVETYKEHCGEDLVAVYIRGSVAKGQAIRGVSDIDTFAYVSLSRENIDNSWGSKARQELEARYPITCGIELEVDPLEQDAVLLNQSVCVYGNPVEVPRLRVDKHLAVHAPNLYGRLTWFSDFLARPDNPESEIREGCVWIMKDLIRVGMELVIERSGKYTRDLYPCYKAFSEYYPEREADMREALHYALNPTSDTQVVKRIADSLGQFLLEETKKVDWQA